MAHELQGFELNYEEAPALLGMELFYENALQILGFEFDVDPQPYNSTGPPWTVTDPVGGGGGLAFSPPAPVWQDD